MTAWTVIVVIAVVLITVYETRKRDRQLEKDEAARLRAIAAKKHLEQEKQRAFEEGRGQGRSEAGVGDSGKTNG